MQRIVGHTQPIERLQRALGSERMHHAWIFAGPRGVGKCTVAIELARLLLDPATAPALSAELQADPDSRVSQLIDAGAHPDLHMIRKELARHSENERIRKSKLSTIPLDVLREHMLGGPIGTSGKYYEPAISHRPVMNHGKVFIIDEAERLDETSQNTLLKTLEEPPKNTYIVLVTSRVERLLPTIRSRCQLVRFGRLDADDMQRWLARSGLEVHDDEQPWIIRFADGAPGIAQLAVEYGLAAWQAELDPLLAQLQAGHFPSNVASSCVELIEQFAKRWCRKDVNRSKDAANKDGCTLLLNLLTNHARHHLHAVVARGAADGGAGDEAAIERWMNVIEFIRRAERRLWSYVNYKLVLENLFAQWASADARAALPQTMV